MRKALLAQRKSEEPHADMVRRFTRRDFLNCAAMAAAAPMFEVKPLRGIDFLLQNSPTKRKFLIETMPGGIALFDYNNDGLLDIFMVNGHGLPSMKRRRVSPRLSSVRNQRKFVL